MNKSDYMLEHPTEPPALITEQSAGLDDQQENSVILAVARLAMFIDTDGTITLQVRQRGIPRDASIYPYIVFLNTSKILMDWTDQTLTWLGVPHYMHWYERPSVKSRSRKSQCKITVQGLKRVMKLLPKMAPYLINKHTQGQNVLEFTRSRLAAPAKARYTDRELELANAVRGKNDPKCGTWRPISSETLRQTHELREELKTRGKIKSDLRRNPQSTTEMIVPKESYSTFVHDFFE